MKMSNKKITKKDLNKVFLRWLLGLQCCWNYEKMQGLGFCYSILPALKKIYPNKEELKEATENHMQFFNTNGTVGAVILGATVALEEEKGLEAREAIAAIKTGLMGPLAGVGDTVFGVIPNTVIGSIASYMALQGNFIGIFLWGGFFVLRTIFIRYLVGAGYKQGTRLVESLGGMLSKITDSANILGMTVVGALVPSVINSKLSYEFTNGEVVMKLQEIADKIMPGLVPVCLVGFTYWLLGRKNMTSSKAIFILMVLGVILFNLKILA